MIDHSYDTSDIDNDFLCDFVKDSYWGQGRNNQEIIESAENSYCISLFSKNIQIGFGRAVSDCVYFAYIFDVYVSENFRAQGLSKVIVNGLKAHPKLKKVNSWMLATSNAHGLYRKMGFVDVNSGRYMILKK